MESPAQALAALADPRIAPEGGKPAALAAENKAYRFPPDYFIYLASGQRLIYLHVDDDSLAAICWTNSRPTSSSNPKGGEKMKRSKWVICVFTVLALAVLCLSVDLPAAAKSRVVLARNAKAINDRNQADAKETARLFDQALLALTGQKTAADSWKTLGLKPGDVVAVKINCNTWTIGLSPHPELMAALCSSLQTVVPANQIIVFDNDSAGLDRQRLRHQPLRQRRALYRHRPGRRL